MGTRTLTGSADSEIDRFIKESCRSYKECNIKNTARRNSLQKRTLGIESERRLASAKLSREERQLREQLKQMNIEKAKNHIIHNLRDHKPTRKTKETVKEEEHVLPTEPYPVTFRMNTPNADEDDKKFEKAGHLYARSHQRRQSREFEDLSLDTGSGQLCQIDEDTEYDEPRRRVYSMSYAQKILSKRQTSRPGTGSSKSSPSLRRKLSRGKGGNSSGSSRESLNESDRITSLDDLHWVGDPEAIHSVRRPRKTVEEQELDAEIHRLGVS